MKIKALIAARSGSMRVKNKNIRPFAGSTLLEVKIEQLLRIPQLDGIVVNSNDDEILGIAQKYGVETVKRDAYYASNVVSMNEVYKNMAEHVDADVIVYANCTNPLLADATITKAIELYKEKSQQGFDSLNTAHLIKEFMFQDNKPINFAIERMPRSQDLPDISALNFAVNILTREDMIARKTVIGANPYIFNIDEVEATDIDNEIDFAFAEYMYNNK
ncbi:MAG: acylneuraminate cytidylyltransferase family protein [Bacteroidales bacterium]|nr:acylneuraminate cytidylyltransferase family protein [Bacteroidales bacterium]